MSRHTENDGKTPRLELDELCDRHYPQLGPSPKIIGKWLRGEISWEEYDCNYRDRMKEAVSAAIIKRIIETARRMNITVMCIDDSPENCHRKIFAEICREISPNLEIIIK